MAIIFKSPGVYVKEVDVDTWHLSKNQIRKLKIKELFKK
jgi:hypothetical protein